MKLIGLAGILALSSLACQRKEEATAAKPPGSAPAENRTAAAGAGEGEEKLPPGKPTKSGPPAGSSKKSPPVAEPVADQPGYVKSPFSGKIIDVRGIPAGRMVADPMFPAAEKKHFRIPETPESDEPSDLPTDEQIASAPPAQGVPGKQGFIFSPYDNKIIDASGIEPGTVFKDPGSPPDAPRFIKLPGGE
jgi:hypothetical protein